MNRRTLFKTASAASLLSVTPALAAQTEANTALRGTVGRFDRIPDLNTESNLDFYQGYRNRFVEGQLRQAVQARSMEVLRAHGIELNSDASLDKVVGALTADPTVAMYLHNWERTQENMWKTIRDQYYEKEDMFLHELASAEKKGPGSLALHRELDIPDYAKYEIHIQPGGYVGDQFAGYIYYHGTNTVFGHDQQQDTYQVTLASAVPIPSDGKIRRILDQGCSCGQFTMALKMRFPEAEVWGDDVAGPMLRYAHMRSVKLKQDLHFVQQLSEKSQFPDGHFDIVTNNLLVHEVPAKQVHDIAAEAYRMLRPGGVYFPLDSYTGDQTRRTALSAYNAWRNFRWNHEVWWMEYYELDMAKAMRDVGFKVDENGPKARPDTSKNVVGYKV